MITVRGLRRPGREFSLLPFWFWNDDLDAEYSSGAIVIRSPDVEACAMATRAGVVAGTQRTMTEGTSVASRSVTPSRSVTTADPFCLVTGHSPR